MDVGETIAGAPVTEEQITDWVAEAEHGFDVDALRRNGRGRPGRGSAPSQVVAVRLTPEELASVDARAAAEGKTRSDVIRDALTATAI
ncbi:MAG: ribbon-helix-helix protein, CopG family [Actinobacteria bacterium]|nr:ribbon-helix-helix protein, CopG family [Actinomycetota bacterium]